MIQFKIMGVPSRLENIHYLQQQLQISNDDVFIDYEYRHNPMWTWKQTVSLNIKEGTTHLCIIQDDTIICDKFVEFCNYLVNRFPNDILKLYNYKNLDKILPRGCIFTPNCNIGGVVTIVPLKYISSIIKQHEEQYPQYIHDDDWICYWAHHNKVNVYNTYPSIVDTFKETTMEHNSKEMFCFCKNPMEMHWVDATNIILSKKHNWSKLVGIE